MGKRIAVITSVYGGFDSLKVPAPQGLDCDWIVVSDIPLSCPPWRAVVEPRPHMRPSMASKVARACPEFYSAADVLIWADANVTLKAGFVREAVAALGGGQLTAFSTAEERPDGIAEEAAVAARLPKYAGQLVAKQAAAYTAAGVPPGLWWTGLRVQSRECPPFGAAWLAEMARWSCECQVSFPYACWRAGIKPADLPSDLSDLVVIAPHSLHFRPQRGRLGAFRLQLLAAAPGAGVETSNGTRAGRLALIRGWRAVRLDYREGRALRETAEIFAHEPRLSCRRVRGPVPGHVLPEQRHRAVTGQQQREENDRLQRG